MEVFDCDDAYIFPLTENLSNSFVDTSKLISFVSNDGSSKYPIGMDNFRSKKPLNKSQSFPVRSSSLSPTQSASPSSLARLRWRNAAFKLRSIKDPWFEFNIEMIPSETAIRHRYNAIKKQWIKDECTVKIESKQFANGAMRACFRLKKLSNFVHKDSWQHASNYVAKCYMDQEIPRERYFDDVKLQMEAKLWAEIFNRHNPPKKIDMFQVSILEFVNRPNSPLYHLEHYIEGNYIKYNSNSGFVEDCNMRSTPQAFSHFTFECSNHELMVVDVQGVGDLYTDPQIHTAKGDDYGDGNLGVKGFALFFSSHVCNKVCKSLGLTKFDLSQAEVEKNSKKINYSKTSSLTVARGLEEFVVGSPSSTGEYFRKRVRLRSENSVCSNEDNYSISDLPDIDESEGYESSSSSPLMSPNSLTHSQSIPMQIPGRSHVFNGHSNPIAIANHMAQHQRAPRIRTESSCLDSAFSVDEAASYFNHIDARNAFKPRPSCVSAEKELRFNHDDDDDSDEEDNQTNKIQLRSVLSLEEESILGKVHFELCKYHEMGRFLENENDEFDSESAFFHLKQAADLGVKEALSTIFKIYLQMPRDVLSSYKVENNDENQIIGFQYLIQSAEKEDKNSILLLAKAFDTGIGLPKNRSIDWSIACDYYKKLLQINEEEGSSEDAGYSEVNTDSEPSYAILARIAEMNMKGGVNFPKNPSEAACLYTEAAEKAMQYGKGRIANKYYMLSEEASAFCED